MTKCIFYQWCHNDAPDGDDSEVCKQCKIERGYPK